MCIRDRRQARIQRLGNVSPLFEFLPGGGKEDGHQYAAGPAHHHGQAFADQGEQRGKVIQWQSLTMQQVSDFTRTSGKS